MRNIYFQHCHVGSTGGRTWNHKVHCDWLPGPILLPQAICLYCVFTNYSVKAIPFFCSSMFWINTMGFNLWRVFNFHSKKRENLRRFLKYVLYAQGMPLLISISTAIADASRPKSDEGHSLAEPHFPNMGVVRCFLGEQYKSDQKYLESAKFIYMDIFILLIQIANIFFLGSICSVLFKGWGNQARLDEMKG